MSETPRTDISARAAAASLSGVGLFSAGFCRVLDMADLERENANLRRRAEEAERKLADLLARIHRDGGHHTAEHGLEKSIKDAHLIVADLHGDKQTAHDAARREAAEILKKMRADAVVSKYVHSSDCVVVRSELAHARERVLARLGQPVEGQS